MISPKRPHSPFLNTFERDNPEESRDSNATAQTPLYRLLIEQSGYGNTIHGAVKRGDESLYGWTAHGLPTNLARFLASHYAYDSSQRYFEMFLHVTEGAYPIVFRAANGHETTLVYQGDQPCYAGITFDIRGDEVHISRAYADGVPLPSDAVVHGRMLFDVAAGCAVPVSNLEAWKTWETIYEELDEYRDDSEGDEWDDDEWTESTSDSPGLRSTRHTIIATLEFFNRATGRLSPQVIDAPDSHCYFRLN